MRHFKPGVIVVWNEVTCTIQDKVEQVYGNHNYHWTITAGRDGQHMKGSKHYDDHALDVRTRNVKEEDLPQIIHDLKEQLGVNYDVVLEPDHLHIEWDPK